MDHGPLVTEETDAGAEFVRRFHSFMPVEVAFWMRDIDERHWSLCIVSKNFEDRTYDLGLGEVWRFVHELKNPYVDRFNMSLARATDPRARAAIDLQRQYPGDIAMRLGRSDFGGISVEGVYVYPASIFALASGSKSA